MKLKDGALSFFAVLVGPMLYLGMALGVASAEARECQHYYLAGWEPRLALNMPLTEWGACVYESDGQRWSIPIGTARKGDGSKQGPYINWNQRKEPPIQEGMR